MVLLHPGGEVYSPRAMGNCGAQQNPSPTCVKLEMFVLTTATTCRRGQNKVEKNLILLQVLIANTAQVQYRGRGPVVARTKYENALATTQRVKSSMA